MAIDQAISADLADVPADAQKVSDLRGAIENRKVWLRVQHAAEAELQAESAPPIPVFRSGSAFLAEHDEGPAYRIDQLWPAGGNVVLAAQFKAGKTTLRDNLIRSLSDYSPFLGQFPTSPLPGRLAVLDAEMPARTARRWLSDQQIANADRFEYVSLRGSTGSFNLLVPQVRTEWAKRLADAGASSLLLDCLGPVLAALGLDENKPGEVGQFLSALEHLYAEAGITESLVIHHMGHDAERSRGASRIRDWPDAEWRLVRQDDNPASPRYLSAYGRDVDLAESRLEYDPNTRHLRISGGSRKSEQIGAALQAICEMLADETGGLSGNAIEKILCPAGHSRAAIREGLRRGLAEAAIAAADGARNARIYTVGTA